MKIFLVWRNILRNPVFRIEGIVYISHDLKTSSGEIRFARKERKGCLLDDSRRDSLLKLRCCPPRIEDS